MDGRLERARKRGGTLRSRPETEEAGAKQTTTLHIYVGTIYFDLLIYKMTTETHQNKTTDGGTMLMINCVNQLWSVGAKKRARNKHKKLSVKCPNFFPSTFF